MPFSLPVHNLLLDVERSLFSTNSFKIAAGRIGADGLTPSLVMCYLAESASNLCSDKAALSSADLPFR